MYSEYSETFERVGMAALFHASRLVGLTSRTHMMDAG